MAITPYPPTSGSSTPSAGSSFESPTARTVSFGTAYQATKSTKPVFVTINLSSTSVGGLAGGQPNVANNSVEVVMGSTTAVSTGIGTKVGIHENILENTLPNNSKVQHKSTHTYTFALPAGWYYSVNRTLGIDSTILSVFEQALG